MPLFGRVWLQINLSHKAAHLPSFTYFKKTLKHPKREQQLSRSISKSDREQTRCPVALVVWSTWFYRDAAKPVSTMLF